MIGWLSGKIIRVFPGGTVLDVNGVGYRIETVKIDWKIGQIVALHIHQQIREDANNLYGFLTVEEFEVFEMLLTVSGVGPKLALAILRSASPVKIYQAISQNQAVFFQSISGVGGKVAAKIVVELKNKIGNGPIEVNSLLLNKDLLDALSHLGYSRIEISSAIKHLPSEINDPKEQIKWALKNFGKKV